MADKSVTVFEPINNDIVAVRVGFDNVGAPETVEVWTKIRTDDLSEPEQTKHVATDAKNLPPEIVTALQQLSSYGAAEARKALGFEAAAVIEEPAKG